MKNGGVEAGIDAGAQYQDPAPIQTVHNPWQKILSRGAFEFAKLSHGLATQQPRTEPPFKPTRRAVIAGGAFGSLALVVGLASRLLPDQKRLYPGPVTVSLGPQQRRPNQGVATPASVDAKGSKDQPTPIAVGVDFEGSKGYASFERHGLKPAGFRNYSVVSLNPLTSFEVDLENLFKLNNAGSLPVTVPDNNMVLLVFTSTELFGVTDKQAVIQEIERDLGYQKFQSSYLQSIKSEGIYRHTEGVVSLANEVKRVFPSCDDFKKASTAEVREKVSRALSLAALKEVQREVAKAAGREDYLVIEAQIEAMLSGYPKELLPVQVKNVDSNLLLSAYTQFCPPKIL